MKWMGEWMDPQVDGRRRYAKMDNGDNDDDGGDDASDLNLKSQEEEEKKNSNRSIISDIGPLVGKVQCT